MYYYIYILYLFIFIYIYILNTPKRSPWFRIESVIGVGPVIGSSKALNRPPHAAVLVLRLSDPQWEASEITGWI